MAISSRVARRMFVCSCRRQRGEKLHSEPQKPAKGAALCHPSPQIARKLRNSEAQNAVRFRPFLIVPASLPDIFIIYFIAWLPLFWLLLGGPKKRGPPVGLNSPALFHNAPVSSVESNRAVPVFGVRRVGQNLCSILLEFSATRLGKKVGSFEGRSERAPDSKRSGGRSEQSDKHCYQRTRENKHQASSHCSGGRRTLLLSPFGI